jgi:arylsulfate sulfotransferase
VSSRLAFGVSRWIALLFLVSMAARVEATISVTLSPSPAGPQPVGTVITWTATVSDTAPGTHQYRFSVGPANGSLAIVRDYQLGNTFQWAFSQTEGTYQVKVLVQNISNNTSAHAKENFVVTTRRVNGLDVVSPTANPLVALFSGPPCAKGNFVRVRFNQLGSSVSQVTNAIPCSATNSANFYIAGMYPSTEYQMHHETVSPSGMIVQTGATYTFTTGPIPGGITVPIVTVPVPAGPPSSITAPILLQANILGAVTTATDLSGNVLWYYHLLVGELTRTELGGRMFVIDSPKNENPPYNATVQEIDLAGNITLQTNAARINQQLALMTDPVTGQPRLPITQFDHEARRLPNGHIVVKGVDEMLVTNAGQCGTTNGVPNTCDVLGTEVLVLNPNLQIVWAWDAFDFLDISRQASLDEICQQTSPGCPAFFLAATANDWLHTNSIQLTEDGSFLVSLRDQDWVIKINYANGKGDGSVLWHMGYQGDFTMIDPPTSPLCTTPNQQQEYAWFTHQHDTNFQLGAESVLTVFDNGNLRRQRCDKDGNSRGYVLTVDETNMTVTPLLIQDLGGYSAGLGSAQVIPGSPNYHFDNGEIVGPSSQSLEITPLGTIAFELDSTNFWSYRTFRMQDMYTPAPPGD